MTIYYVHIGVALKRPPTIDEYRRYAVEAPDGVQATLVAAQMASGTSVMPVWSELVGDTAREGSGPQHWRGPVWVAADSSHTIPAPCCEDSPHDRDWKSK